MWLYVSEYFNSKDFNPEQILRENKEFEKITTAHKGWNIQLKT